jgi:hypothetical protein
MKEIAAAFVKAKKNFGPVIKDKLNPAFKSKYADLGAVLEAVEPALLDQGIALYQETSESPDGVIVETVLLHTSGETLRFGRLNIPATKKDPQGFGSALSYARRYSLMAACGVVSEDDDGQRASRVFANKSDPDRAAWLAEQRSLIAKAKTAGELKLIVAEAVSFAEGINDMDAAEQVREAAKAKINAKATDAQAPA